MRADRHNRLFAFEFSVKTVQASEPDCERDYVSGNGLLKEEDSSKREQATEQLKSESLLESLLRIALHRAAFLADRKSVV